MAVQDLDAQMVSTHMEFDQREVTKTPIDCPVVGRFSSQ